MEEANDQSGSNSVPQGANLPAGFEAIELLGEGSHGIVYKALETLLSRVVALKIIKLDTSSDAQKQIERFKREAQALAKLNHPNIVKVFQVGISAAGAPFLACEYLEGQTLADYIKQHGTLTNAELSQIFNPLLDALGYAHTRGLVHRDLKPGNIMIVSSSGSASHKVKLLDFGIVRDTTIAEGQSADMTSMMLGTPLYMSPEQCGGSGVDCRSDFYSLACVIFECLFGHPPFVAETAYSVMYKHLNEQASEGLSEPDKTLFLQDSLGKFILKCLSKNPNERPRDCAEFKSAMKDALSRTRLGASASSRPAVRLVAISLGVLLALIGLILAAKFTGTGTQLNLHHSTGIAALAKKKSNLISGTPGSRLAGYVTRYRCATQLTSDDASGNTILVEVLQGLRQEEKDFLKGPDFLLFAYWYLRARTCRELGLDSAEMEALNKALSICRNQDGTYKREAVFVYLDMAALSASSPAEELVTKAEKLETNFNHGEGNVLAIDLPEKFNLARDEYIPASFLMARAQIARTKHDYKTCLKLLLQTEEIVDERFGKISVYTVKTKRADVLEDMGKSNAGVEIVSDFEKMVRQLPVELPNRQHKPYAFLAIGKWARKHNHGELAKRCFESGLEAGKTSVFENRYVNAATRQELNSLLLELAANNKSVPASANK